MFAAPAPALIPLQNLKQYPNDTRTLVSNGVKPAGYVQITDPQREFAGFSVNVVLTTVLFIVIFVTASSWTLAVNKEFEHKAGSIRYWIFSLVMTLVTVGLSIGFGELAHAVNKKVNITVTNLLGSGIE